MGFCLEAPEAIAGDASGDPDTPKPLDGKTFVLTGTLATLKRNQAQELPWRWYLRTSRSVSRRAPGDRQPPRPGPGPGGDSQTLGL